MSATINLHTEADDQQLLAQVVGYYHATFKETPDALDYLQRRGITNAQAVDHFRIGYADRSLGLKLPSKQSQAGAALRERLQELGLFRESGHEHFRGSVTFPICAADGSGRIVDIYGRKVRDDLRKGTPTHTHLNDKKQGVWNVEAFGAGSETGTLRLALGRPDVLDPRLPQRHDHVRPRRSHRRSAWSVRRVRHQACADAVPGRQPTADRSSAWKCSC